jgi:hypothetical protein
MFKVTNILAVVGAVLGALILFLTLAASKGAPQEAAGAAIALCFTVIPYCINGLVWRSRMLDQQRRAP